MGWSCGHEFGNSIADPAKLTTVIGFWKEKRWNPCFMQLQVETPQELRDGLTLHFNISYDYSTEYIDSLAFGRRVNYWLKIGRLLGLDLEGATWNVYKEDVIDESHKQYGEWGSKISGNSLLRVLSIHLPFKRLSKVENQEEQMYRAVWLHAFFLRYLYELHAVIDAYKQFRAELKKTHPMISRLGVLILAENYSKLANKVTGTEFFAHREHRFLFYKGPKAVLHTCKGIGHSNLWKHFVEANVNRGSSFDDHLLCGFEVENERPCQSFHRQDRDSYFKVLDWIAQQHKEQTSE